MKYKTKAALPPKAYSMTVMVLDSSGIKPGLKRYPRLSAMMYLDCMISTKEHHAGPGKFRVICNAEEFAELTK